MCGIAGFFDPNASFMASPTRYNHILSDMCHCLHHRGPDSQDFLLSNRCGLAHARLSIIDLAGGSQPMTRQWNDHRYHIIYNGEIYNIPYLRQQLKRFGCTPTTTSDTEVLLLSYMKWGADFVKEVDGIFAFAIYDEWHETITLFRDSFGVKPLFYTLRNGTLVFASELKGIFCFPDIPARIGKEGLNELLSLGPARNPGAGIFENFNEIKPGTYATYSKLGMEFTNYFRLESRPHMDSYEETIEKTSFLVTDAIERQMVSDVPICTFLSGGVDSSVVSAVCSRKMKESAQKLTTFSFDFTENDKYFKANRFQPSQDRPYVEKMVDFLGSNHIFLECSDREQADLLYDSVEAHDLPCMVDIDSSLLFFCNKVSQSHKVVLTGECADEVFGGYPWFHREEFLTGKTFPWTPDLSPRKYIFNEDLITSLQMDDYVQNSYNNAIREINFLPEENEIETNRRRIGYLNIRYFMQTLLNRMDRTSMHSGLEARVPFADRELVQYIFNVPWEMKAKDGEVKNVLRQAARGLLPDEILFRKKSPYPKTYNPFYEQLLTKRLKKLLENGNSPLLPLINQTNVAQFLTSPKDYGAPWYGQLMAGPQMIAYLIQLDYFLRRYHVEIVL